jgi:hypothetical protein
MRVDDLCGSPVKTEHGFQAFPKSCSFTKRTQPREHKLRLIYQLCSRW